MTQATGEGYGDGNNQSTDLVCLEPVGGLTLRQKGLVGQRRFGTRQVLPQATSSACALITPIGPLAKGGIALCKIL